MSCAILLDKQKYDIEIVEQSGQFRNIGFSIVLWRSGFEPLRRLLMQAGVSLSEGSDYFKVDGFRIYGHAPLKLIRRFSAAGYGWAFKRQRLMELLEQALRKILSADKIVFSKAIRHISYDSPMGPAHIAFRDGTNKEYDVVVIAEGVHSSSRELIAVQERVISKPYALRYAWFTSETELETDAALFFTAGQVAVIHPPRANNLLGFYFDKGTPEGSQKRFEEAICARIRKPDGGASELDLNTSDVFELKEVHLDRYNASNAVVIGDAAHGRPPTLGFGTSLAIEDATLLARLLNALEDRTAEHIADTLRGFSDIRVERVESVYHLQSLVENFYTKNRIKLLFLDLIAESFLGRYFERNMKQLASYQA